jgi:hypothetical protein
MPLQELQLLEPANGELRGGYELLIEDDRVRECSEGRSRAQRRRRRLRRAHADAGLIDCHVHVIHSEVNIRFMEAMPLTLLTARAATRLRAMLDRGFTTVRDTGGCDWGIKTGRRAGSISSARACSSPASPLDPPAVTPTAGSHGHLRGLCLLQRPAVQIGDRRRLRRGA